MAAVRDSNEMTDDTPRPGYEPFPVNLREKTWLNRVDGRLRRRLPRPAYESMLAGYHGLRRVARRNPGRGRMLPDFVIIGAAKAATTSLYAWLCEHPDVVRARAKEIHYFSWFHYRGEDWYRHFFPLERDRAVYKAEHGRPFITGEASPSYMLDGGAPPRMAALIPDAKLIVQLRNPVDRAYSQFQMRRRDDEESIESFLGAVAAERAQVGPPITRTYVARGLYAEQLERWLAVFPREQLHVLAMEDLATDPQRVLDRVHEFLGIAPRRAEDLEARYTAKYDPLPAEERAQLTEYFRPHNERLYELLGRDFGWER
jgi:hypothetical protein